MTVTCNYRSTAVIILPGVYLPPQRNATVADDAFSLLFISIHAPREGSDRGALSSRERVENFNPRSPRGERPDNLFLLPRLSLFQSTLPARGATLAGKPFAYYELISIHAPREGSDLLREGRTNKERNFNPRSPRGERPRWSRKTAGSSHFNPRSPRGERQIFRKAGD